MKNRFGCMCAKFIGIMTVILGILFVPYELHFFKEGSLIGAIFMGLVITTFGFISLLKTNNPLTRYNPFSLNPKWKNKMDPINENPRELFRLDKPDEGEVKRISRDVKINKLLK